MPFPGAATWISRSRQPSQNPGYFSKALVSEPQPRPGRLPKAAGRGNKFWKTLHKIGLTPHQLQPAQYEDLLMYRLGLTDLVKNKAGMDRVLASGDFGSDDLVRKMLACQPQVLCFNGKRSAKEFLRRNPHYGLQSETIGQTRIFVAPSTSGAANQYWDIQYWHKLGKLLKD